MKRSGLILAMPFFNESLPKYQQFAPAFAEAIVNIGKRERTMGFEPSEPQYVIGEEMRKMLPEFEKTLKPLTQYNPVQSLTLSSTS